MCIHICIECVEHHLINQIHSCSISLVPPCNHRFRSITFHAEHQRSHLRFALGIPSGCSSWPWICISKALLQNPGWSMLKYVEVKHFPSNPLVRPHSNKTSKQLEVKHFFQLTAHVDNFDEWRNSTHRWIWQTWRLHQARMGTTSVETLSGQCPSCWEVL